MLELAIFGGFVECSIRILFLAPLRSPFSSGCLTVDVAPLRFFRLRCFFSFLSLRLFCLAAAMIDSCVFCEEKLEANTRTRKGNKDTTILRNTKYSSFLFSSPTSFPFLFSLLAGHEWEIFTLFFADDFKMADDVTRQESTREP
jgi:hypothetical protein